ncbi:MAG: M67 family metallopeptidase [Acidimicrobiales bacterium]
MLLLPASVLSDLLAHLVDGLPDEACGLLSGHLANGDAPCVVDGWYPSSNQAKSSRVYTIDPKVHLRADRDAEDRGGELVGVVHSHTHSEPYPSPTDVAQAPDPAWHYVIVSFRLGQPMVRSYRIIEGQILEEAVSVLES